MPLGLKLIIIVFFGFFGLCVLGFILLIVKLLSNAKKDSFTGTVVDKMHNTKRVNDDGFKKIEHFYVLVVDVDGGGRQRKLGVAKALFDQFETGDRIEKVKGEMLPKRLEK